MAAQSLSSWTCSSRRNLDLTQISKSNTHTEPCYPSRIQIRPPRSIIVNFLQFAVKETVLKLAWQKQIQVQSHPISFNHNYAAEIMQKRKGYNGIKKVLKEEKIRFQTPFTKIHIHWSDETRTYNTPDEVEKDLMDRGIIRKSMANNDGGSASDPRINPHEERLQSCMTWQSAGNKDAEKNLRVQQKFQEFQRMPPKSKRTVNVKD